MVKLRVKSTVKIVQWPVPNHLHAYTTKTMSYVEPFTLTNVRIENNKLVSVFGKPLCSECGGAMYAETITTPHRKSETYTVWHCSSRYCLFNQKVYLAECTHCGDNKPEGFEDRMLLDSRFCPALSAPRIWGPWCACRVCGNYNDTDQRTAYVLKEDPVITMVSRL